MYRTRTRLQLLPLLLLRRELRPDFHLFLAVDSERKIFNHYHQLC